MQQHQDNRECVIHALQTLLAAPLSTEEIAQLFTPDYVQQVDGKTLDYAAFVQHMATLWQHAATISLRFEQVFAQDHLVASLHYPSVRKHDGSEAHYQVIALFEVRAGRICRCVEQTRLLSGQEVDRDMGSR